tara:strand:+ start:491 stop:715 length:225 start_codon:yes stop_codon:yes gene_type:complete
MKIVVVIAKMKTLSMAKTTTRYDFSGASKDSSKNQILNNKQKPSAKALQFVLDYAKSASMIKTKALNSFVFIAN